MIDIRNITKDYGNNQGAFNVSFTVNKGDVFGFIGPNGAGKTTVIRHLMGFLKPQSGSSAINQLDCWQEAAAIKKLVGYLPGELAFPANISGKSYLAFIEKLHGEVRNPHIDKLITHFNVDLNANIGAMSLGTKRKLALILSFIHDPEILILDEPTSGLDPIMQQVFIDWILSEKKQGKTILLSSHMFEEVETVCDHIAFIKDGQLITSLSQTALNHERPRTYTITCADQSAFNKATDLIAQDRTIKLPLTDELKNTFTIEITGNAINHLLAILKQVPILDFVETSETLESHFLNLYNRHSPTTHKELS